MATQDSPSLRLRFGSLKHDRGNSFNGAFAFPRLPEDAGERGAGGAEPSNLGPVVRSLPYADVCENNELRTYCISIKPLSMSGR